MGGNPSPGYSGFAQYWPDEGEKTFGSVRVKILGEDEITQSGNLIKSLMVDGTKRVKHLSCLKWPNYGVPKTTGNEEGSDKERSDNLALRARSLIDDHSKGCSLLSLFQHTINIALVASLLVGPVIELLKLVKSLEKEGETIAIHCSGGVGRSGTFLTCYAKIFGEGRNNGENLIDIVEQIREQRHPMAVEGFAQYKFANEVVRDYED